VLAAGAYRYWVARKARPTFATSLAGGIRPAPSARPTLVPAETLEESTR
jgi:hypothetical protein